jgi:hypothetical protein
VATNSVIAYEAEAGKFVGVDCYWDGYPGHMLPILRKMFFADVAIMVNHGLATGGLNSVNRDGTWSTNGEDRLEPYSDLPRCDFQYSYVKMLDGSVMTWEGEGDPVIYAEDR